VELKQSKRYSSVWYVYHHARYTGFGWEFSQAGMFYNTRDGQTFPVNVQEGRPADHCLGFLRAMLERPELVKIGRRMVTALQMEPVHDTLELNLAWLSVSETWELKVNRKCPEEECGGWTRFHWTVEERAMKYTTPANLSKYVAMNRVQWDKSRCDACGNDDTRHGTCIHCESAACFCAGRLVELSCGTEIPVESLQVGDKVLSEACYSTIQEIHTSLSDVRVCTIGTRNLPLTDKHPVLYASVWTFPDQVVTSHAYHEQVWNFVRDGQPEEKAKHTIVVNGMLCATLGCAPCPILQEQDPDGDRLVGSGFWNTRTAQNSPYRQRMTTSVGGHRPSRTSLYEVL
jgi:hypothetical protein